MTPDRIADVRAMTNAVPNPGSAEAIAKGCTCPVLDNAHGRGYYGRTGMFVISGDCEMHREWEPVDG